MKYLIIILIIFHTLNLQAVAQESEENNHIGFGIGAGYGGIGVRYDYEALPSFLISAIAGGAGLNVGLRYKFCTSDKNNCLITSGYVGENHRQESASDTLVFNKSVMIGIDYQHYFTESWSYELGLYYLKFNEDNEFYDTNDDVQISIGLAKSF